MKTSPIADRDYIEHGRQVFWRVLGIIVQDAGVKAHMATVDHHQTDGQTVRTNQVQQGYLRTFLNYDPKD